MASSTNQSTKIDVAALLEAMPADFRPYVTKHPSFLTDEQSIDIRIPSQTATPGALLTDTMTTLASWLQELKPKVQSIHANVPYMEETVATIVEAAASPYAIRLVVADDNSEPFERLAAALRTAPAVGSESDVSQQGFHFNLSGKSSSLAHAGLARGASFASLSASSLVGWEPQTYNSLEMLEVHGVTADSVDGILALVEQCGNLCHLGLAGEETRAMADVVYKVAEVPFNRERVVTRFDKSNGGESITTYIEPQPSGFGGWVLRQ